METLQSPTDWAKTQFGGCRLGDKRRTERLVHVGCSMLSRSSASIPKQMDGLASVKGAYRLFGMEKVTHEAICAPHWESTRAQASLPGQGLILFVQDQTEVNFGPKPDSYELGFTSDTRGRGIEVQTSLCVLPDPSGLDRPEVLGIALQTPWLRKHAPRKKIETNKEATSRRTEYDAWEESVVQIGPAPPSESGTVWVSVGDRASDVFTHLFTATALGWKCLIRSKYDRKLCDCTGPDRLHQRARSLEPMGTTSISLRSRPARKGIASKGSKPAQEARTVLLNLAYFPAQIKAPRKVGKDRSLELTCIRVWEDPSNAPVPEPIEWLLLTTLPVNSLSDALLVVRLYRQRWLVEEYHKCLKTGCKMEERNLTHANKLLALLGVLSIVAVFLLQLKTPNQRTQPPEELIRLVRHITKAKEDLGKPSALLRRIAMIGGFLGRKGDGEPGWQTIWDGWTRLQDILWGIELAEAMRCG
jgi:Transposase DNA-binding/Transposase Tn5 dimerisation domain/Transposase DDE domain